jgi:hypothetical protein
VVLRALCGLAIVAGVSSPVLAQDAGSLVKFYWAGQVAHASKSHPTSEPVRSTELSLGSGDRLQFYLSPAKPCYLYFLHAGPDGELETLYPEGDAAGKPLTEGSQQYLGWYELDKQRGREMLFLVVSARPLSALERLIEDHRRAGSADRAAAARRVLDEIGRLKTRYQKPETSASHAPVIAGSMRAGPINLAAEAQEMKADTLFALTYILEHK